MVRGEFLFQRWLGLTFTALFLLLSGLDSARAETDREAGDRLATANIPLTDYNPQLPPLGDYSKFIPFEEHYRRPSRLVTTRLVIKLSERRVYVYRNEKVATSYPIAVGKTGWETPTGSFQVIQMLRDPIWEHPWTGELVYPGPDNPLGARWIGFWTDGKDSIGFHGTPNESLIGQAVSHGCIRMYNKDILSLYAQVDVGTPVIVEP
ncbi:L,D-transpeptidase [Oxynema sp. CENA135]|uniref:L,D-transpeptidase n=1 Tax=Oxynema sp. CENA135 TaxID=984206 RepID=UPI00190D6BD1|nr:L,D-transpeptidase [Oxynema sp. CENA135]MBK4730563.1 L,D-transpeptidase [Oxynema sp. CENA135]